MVKKPGKDPQQSAKPDRPRVIVKKAKGHGGGHHGGAWKVAYADFVTAMMALFIVLWVLGASDKKFKAGLAHYFREPGVFAGSRGIIPNGGEDKMGAGIIQSPSLEVLQAHLKQEFQNLKNLIDAEAQIPMEITPEGLLIEMIDKDNQAFFELSSANVKSVMRAVLEIIVKEVRDTSYKLAVGGHTDARPYHNESYYSNWELSTTRALNTRRVLEDLGLPSERIQRVVGYADRHLRVADDPLSPANRRISILILRPDSKETDKLP